MDFVEALGAKVNTVKQVIRRAFFFFCVRGQDQPSIFNRCLSYFDSFKLAVCLNEEFDLWPDERFRASCPSYLISWWEWNCAFTRRIQFSW